MSKAKIDGSMAAILGLPASEVENICKEIDGTIEAVNYNEPKQTVVAGEKSVIEKALFLYEFNAIVRAITAQLGELKEENTSCSHRKLIHFNNFKKI